MAEQKSVDWILVDLQIEKNDPQVHCETLWPSFAVAVANCKGARGKVVRLTRLTVRGAGGLSRGGVVRTPQVVGTVR